jgi:hypothetical protein
MALLDDPAHEGMAKDPAQTVEWRNVLLIKRLLPEDVTEQLQPHGLNVSRLYEGVSKSI